MQFIKVIMHDIQVNLQEPALRDPFFLPQVEIITYTFIGRWTLGLHYLNSTLPATANPDNSLQIDTIFFSVLKRW